MFEKEPLPPSSTTADPAEQSGQALRVVDLGKDHVIESEAADEATLDATKKTSKPQPTLANYFVSFTLFKTSKRDS